MSEPLNHITENQPAMRVAADSFFYFSEILNRKICIGKIDHRIGKLTNLVFRHKEHYAEVLGIYLDHGWGKPNEFIPCEKIVKIDDDAIFVAPPEGGPAYPPFVDQPGYMLINEHLMGKTILDMDGRRVEVVNDVHLLESKGRIIIVHVDISINGFLRNWGLVGLKLTPDQLIPWRYVQPLSLEDAANTKAVTLSVTRKQIKELPPEDLADALEELSGHEQQAVFSALDSEKAAETLVEAEPRAQRQLIASLRNEKAKAILAEMSIAQIANLLSVLPHEDVKKMTALLPKERQDRIETIISQSRVTAKALLSVKYIAVEGEAKVGDVLGQVRAAQQVADNMAYLYVVDKEKHLQGVVDLRDMLLAPDAKTMNEIKVAPVVSADENDIQEDLAELFAKYHFRLLPVVDAQDHLLGVVRFGDIMGSLETMAKG